MRCVAATLWLVCACGSSNPTGSSDAAGPSDARPDGAADAAPDGPPQPGVVDITVYDLKGAPAADMPVVFLAADGSTVATTSTDATGVASATVFAGASVTAQRPNGPGSASEYVTYLAVKPGDHLVVGNPPRPTLDDQIPVSLPPNADIAGYSLRASCDVNAGGGGDPSGIGRLLVPPGCTTADIYVQANTKTNQMAGFFFVPDATLTPGVTLDLTAQTLTPPTTITATLDNLPDFGFPPFLDADLAVDGFLFGGDITTSQQTGGAHQTGVIVLPALAGSTLEVETQLTDQNGGGGDIQVFDRVPDTDAYSFDYAAHAMPEMGPPSAAGTSITWSETGTGDVDLAGVSVLVRRGTALAFRWTVVGPYTPGTLPLPVLPAPLDFMTIEPDDIVSAANGVAFLARLPGGYDAVRATVMNFAGTFGALHTQGGGAYSFPQIGTLPDYEAQP